jgi:diadenosine tetraphosphatase ApaH/serine/threonine PP2A family protein phosphatase
VDIVRSKAWQGICGNHDWASAKNTDLVLFNPYAREAILWTRQNLRPQSAAYLADLGLTYKDDAFGCVHASLFEPEKFHYLDNYGSIYREFPLMDESGLTVVFVAHTHIPATFIYKGENLYRDHSTTIEISPRYKYVINIGSVGQPRDRDPRSCFCIFDTKAQSIKFVRVEYDIEKAQEDILAQGLPKILSSRLETGW